MVDLFCFMIPLTHALLIKTIHMASFRQYWMEFVVIGNLYFMEILGALRYLDLNLLLEFIRAIYLFGQINWN